MSPKKVMMKLNIGKMRLKRQPKTGKKNKKILRMRQRKMKKWKMRLTMKQRRLKTKPMMPQWKPKT